LSAAQHRPAWDDFETVVVEGSDEAREVLLGQTSSVADWAPLLDPSFERRGAYLAYEAMTADRAYRAALSHDEAQAELRAGSGTQFDPVVVQAFLQVLAPGGRRLRRQVGAPAV
jgi:hypothetical protein